VTPALPPGLISPATLNEVGVWQVEKVSRLTAMLLLEALNHIPLANLDYLFLEENRDPTCEPPSNLGCHARGLVLPASGGLEQIDLAAAAIVRSDVILITQGDLREESRFDFEEARRRIGEIEAGLPVYVLSHTEHSEWLEWMDYLERLRRVHLPGHGEEAPSSDLYFG
jgi:Ni2+-binding GTPase involved in maturation of urease and hydrogenase